MIGVHAHHPVDHRPVSIRVSTEPVPHRDPFQYQDTAFKLDLSGRVGAETTVSGWDTARLQGAAQRPGQSTSRRGDDIVQRGRVRLVLALPQPVMRGDLAVHTEHNRRVLRRHPGVPQRPASPFHLHVRPVDNITHDTSSPGTGTPSCQPQGCE